VRAIGGGGKGRISTAGNGALGGTYWNDFEVGDAWEQKTFTNLVANGTTVRLAFDMGYIADKTYYIDDIVFDDTDMEGTGIFQPVYADWTGKIYSSDKGKIDVIAPIHSEVQVVDILGKIIATRTVSGTSLQFSVHPAGIYIVSVKNDGRNYTQKVIVK
jgi:hypothetical protein